MGNFAVTVRNGWLDGVTASTLYLALFVGDPEGAGVEVSGSNYARKSVASTDWANASAGSITTTSELAFAQATDVWSASDITHWALFDAATSGTLKASDDLPVSQQQPIVAGNTIKFAIGSIAMTVYNEA